MRNILMVDTGCSTVHAAADWFASRGDRVTLLTPAEGEPAAHAGVQGVAVDWMDAPALAQAAQEAAGLQGLDILVLGVPACAPDGPIGTGHDADAMEEALVRCARGTLNLLDCCLPLMQQGMKRIGCITTRESSIGWHEGRGDLTNHAAMAGMNMLGKLMFNRLRPQGFTFRWYCDEGKAAPMCAAEYMVTPLSYDPREPAIHNEEDRIVMRNGFLKEIPW